MGNLDQLEKASRRAFMEYQALQANCEYCDYCDTFFKRFRCSASTHGECDCPKCQGFCECKVSEKDVGA